MNLSSHLSNSRIFHGKYNNNTWNIENQARIETISKLSQKEYEVWNYLIFMKATHEIVNVGQQRIANIFNICREYVNKIIAKLTKLGLLVKEYRHRKTCLYKLPEWLYYKEIYEVLYSKIEALIFLKNKLFTPIRNLIICNISHLIQDKRDIQSWRHAYQQSIKFEKTSSHLEAGYHLTAKVLWSEEDEKVSLDESFDFKNKKDYRNSRMFQSIIEELKFSPDEIERVKDYSKATIQYVWNSYLRNKSSIVYPKRWFFNSLESKKDEKYWNRPLVPKTPKKIFSNEEPYEHLTLSQIRSNFMYRSEFPKQRAVEFLDSSLFKEMPPKKQQQYKEEIRKKGIYE